MGMLMPSYRGNIGNLLQHWVLCELIERSHRHWDRLRFVDAYSMAPLATERFKPGSSGHLFDHARDRVKTDSIYEQAWGTIVGDGEGYPNSAAFVDALWPGRYSMLLCEDDRATVIDLRTWALQKESKPNCLGVRVALGDWRKTFERGGWQSEDLTVQSFDPDMLNRHGSDNGRNMTPSDLALVARTIERGHRIAGYPDIHVRRQQRQRSGSSRGRHCFRAEEGRPRVGRHRENGSEDDVTGAGSVVRQRVCNGSGDIAQFVRWLADAAKDQPICCIAA